LELGSPFDADPPNLRGSTDSRREGRTTQSRVLNQLTT
jgi:hypothetical protein